MTSTLPPVILRPITGADRDLEGGLALSQAVLWPYRKEDWRIAQELGDGVVAEEDGRIVASALWWLYGETFATCGIIIVLPEMQGRGLGRILMDTILSATAGRSVLLNSTAEGHRLYQAYGFRDIGTVHQHQACTSAAMANMPFVGADDLVRVATEEDLPAILRLDKKAFGVERSRLIDAFARIGDLAVIDRNGSVEGYAICRPFGLGQAIGPVIARSSSDAQSLIRHFLRTKAGEFVRVDIPGESGLGGWLAEQGLPEVNSVITMLRGYCPSASGPDRVYCLASQSFG